MDDDRVRQLSGLLLVRFAAHDVIARELVLAPLQLVIGNRFRFQAIELRDERRRHFLGRVSRLDNRNGIEQIRILDQVGVAECSYSHLLFVHELVVDPRRLAVRQHLRRDVQRIRIRVAVVRDVVRNDHGGQRPRLAERHPFFLRLRRLLGNVARHLAFRLRHAPEVLGGELQRLGGIEVPDEHARCVRRYVVRAIEIPHVVDRRRFEIGHAADRGVFVRMNGERLVVDDFVQPAVRLVVDAHPPLFLHDVALVRERVLIDAQRGHPIGLEPEHERQILRRHRFPEDGLVVGRIGVALAPDGRNHRRVRFRLHVFRPFEHQMLEEVREPGAARLLVLRADVIPKLQMDDRRRMILRKHERQPVGKSRDLVLQFGRTNGRRRGLRDGAHDRDADQDCKRSIKSEHY